MTTELTPNLQNGGESHRLSPANYALFRISRKLLHPDAQDDTLQLRYDLLRAMYDLDKLETDLLALLICRGIGKGLYEYVRKYVKAEPEEIEAAWYRLEERQIIRREWDGMVEVRKADELFEKALNTGRHFDEMVSSLISSRFETLAGHLFEPTCKSPWGKLLPMQDEEDYDTKPQQEAAMAELAQFHDLLCRYKTDAFASRYLAVTDGLCPEEEALLLGLIRHFQTQFTKAVRENELTGLVSEYFKAHIASLMEKGLVVSVYIWHEKKETDAENYRIAPEVAEVFRGQERIIDKRAISKLASYIPCEKMEAKELLFPEKDLLSLERLCRAAQPSEYERIIAELKRNHLRPCLSALMYGPPGTGKTELARQIAIRTGRSLLIADAPKLGGVYLGEAEVNFREFFQVYRYVCAVSERCPILLLDEADGLIGKRISRLSTSGDKHSNTVQNVILEELNSMPGIFLATTNLVDNMDEAMKRRFMIKAEFHLPDAETRRAIWLSKIPTLREEEAAVLAERFPLSGGLIDNVASVAIVNGIVDNRQVTLEELLDICASQLMQSGEPSRPIGFHHCQYSD